MDELRASDGRPPDVAPPLGGRAAQGFAWTSRRALFVQLLSLISFVVLARLLDPEDFGVVAFANVFCVLLQLIAAGGLAQAIVQRPEVDEVDLDSAFWMALAMSVGLALILCAAAWPLAAAFDEPQLRPVLQALALVLPFAGARSVHLAMLQRRLAFELLAKIDMVANLIAT